MNTIPSKITALVVAVAIAIATIGIIACIQDSEAAVTSHGTESAPLTELTATADDMINDSDRAYYVLVGSTVVVSAVGDEAGEEFAYNVAGTTSGFGLSFDSAYESGAGSGRVSGTLSKAGDVTVRLTGYNGSTDYDVSVTIHAVAQTPTEYTHTVRYEPVNGTGNMEDSFVKDSESGTSPVTLKDCAFEKSGSHFVGWSIGNVTYQPGDSVQVPGNGTLIAYASWAPDTFTHTVRYDANEGTGTMGDTVVLNTVSGESDVVLAECGFTYAGHEFTGWKVGSTVYQPGQSVKVAGNANVQAVAQWEEATTPASYSHMVMYVCSQEHEGNTRASAELDDNSGDTLVQLAECGFTREGYDFAGWMLQTKTYQPGDKIPVPGNETVTVIATWTAIQVQTYTHTVRYDSNGGTGNMDDTFVENAVSGESDVVLAECGFVREGFYFVAWTIGGIAYQPGDSLRVGSDSPVTVSAKWQETASVVSHTVRYDKGAAEATGTMIDSVSTNTVSGESDIVLAQCGFAREGYEFAGWKVGSTVYQSGQSVKVAGNATVTAIAQWNGISESEEDADDEGLPVAAIVVTVIGALVAVVGLRLHPAILVAGIVLAAFGALNAFDVVDVLASWGLR